ncbi:MAG: polyprenyl synthetase family protein, partial [Nitrospinota bacterium]
AGDALLTHTFELLTHPDLTRHFPPTTLLSVINEIAQAAGCFGMIGGQVVDMESEGQQVDLQTIEYIHTHKTAALIRVSVRSGGVLAGGNGEEVAALTAYGENIGLAFQIIDDILDIKGEQERLGKQPGSDISRHKATFPAVVGLEESTRRAREALDRALSALEIFGERGETLRELARFIVEREF